MARINLENALTALQINAKSGKGSRELSLAITKVEESLMWLEKAESPSQ